MKNLLSSLTARDTLIVKIMTVLTPRQVSFAIVFALSAISFGCTTSAGNELFFGKTTPPAENILRYVSGSEPETLDPQIPDGQNEARLDLALYEGLVEYDPNRVNRFPRSRNVGRLTKTFQS